MNRTLIRINRKELPQYAAASMQSKFIEIGSGGTVSNVTNNDSRPVEVSFGDTIINGADKDTVQQHMKVNEDMVNQIAKILGIRR
jgi:hypothetical protein